MFLGKKLTETISQSLFCPTVCYYQKIFVPLPKNNIIMPKENITIKDIAARAGVSTGTVDRVLHNRPNVSQKALDKVNKALEELDYQPNMYASALAYNKTYTFYIVLPKHEQDAYWDEIEEGAQACCNFRRDFGITLKFVYYERFNATAFTKMVREFFSGKMDGVVIVPTTLEQTARFTEKLTERSIPYVLLDSYMPDLKPLSFFGQDSLPAARRGEKGIRWYPGGFLQHPPEGAPLHHLQLEGPHRGRVPTAHQPPQRADHGLRHGAEERGLRPSGQYLIPHRPACLPTRLCQRRCAV